MTKLTYAQQVKADRKAEARRRLAGDDYRQDAGIKQIYQHHTMTAKAEKLASINRRLAGRMGHLADLGLGYNDTHLFLLQELSSAFTNTELLSKLQGQTQMMWKFDAMIRDEFDTTPIEQPGLVDDGEATPNSAWIAWFVTDDMVPQVKQYIRQIVADFKAA